jgi:hypothetical protein
MAEIKEIKKTAAKPEDSRTRSPHSCPYFDLDQSIKVAEVIYQKGGGSASPDLLALWLDYSSTRSGTYLTRVSAAKVYGLIESEGDVFSVTERAKLILSPVMPDDAVKGKVEAFLSVPLFSKAFEAFKGQQLPPRVGLENLFRGNYKIVNDRVTPSVRIFLNAAEQAGMLASGKDGVQRLVKPIGTGQSAHTPASTKEDTKIEEKPIERQKGGGEGPPGGIHTAIVGILRELPPVGTPFPEKKKERFLIAFEAILDVVYPSEKGEGQQ